MSIDTLPLTSIDVDCLPSINFEISVRLSTSIAINGRQWPSEAKREKKHQRFPLKAI